MPQVSELKPALRRTGGVEPLRRKRVAAAPAPSSAARRRALNILLIFVIVVLVADALIGEKGLRESVHARQQYREVAASLEALRRDNIRLRDEARRLREDPGAIESMAREQLGLIRPGEVLFIIKDEKPAR
jgi:cell division protein FtsB